jgi:hypothetical protein
MKRLGEIASPDPMHVTVLIYQDAGRLDRSLGIRMRFKVVLTVQLYLISHVIL